MAPLWNNLKETAGKFILSFIKTRKWGSPLAWNDRRWRELTCTAAQIMFDNRALGVQPFWFCSVITPNLLVCLHFYKYPNVFSLKMFISVIYIVVSKIFAVAFSKNVKMFLTISHRITLSLLVKHTYNFHVYQFLLFIRVVIQPFFLRRQ